VRQTRLLALALATGPGCGITATVTYKTGAKQEGEIVRGDATHLVIATPEQRLVIPKAEIADIDHPGDVMASIGAGVAATGILNLTTPFLKCTAGNNTFCMGWLGGGMVAATGLVLTTLGLISWQHSVTAATEVSLPALTVAPVIWDPDQRGNHRLGAALSLRY